MKVLTINSLMQYGQTLYDRGEFNEACAVFNHVLTYDKHQPQALQYLKELGRSPVTMPNPTLKERAGQEHGAEPNIIVIKKTNDRIASPVDVSDTESLKAVIEAKKKSIEKLRVQIRQMKANLASP